MFGPDGEITHYGYSECNAFELSLAAVKKERFDRLIEEILYGQSAITWFKGISHTYGKECKQMSIDRVQKATKELWEMVNGN